MDGQRNPTGNIINISTISGSHNPVIAGSNTVQMNYLTEGQATLASGPSQSQAAGQATSLDEKTLQHVAQKLGRDWEKLALELGIGGVKVSTIEGDHPGNTERQGREMLLSWKQSQPAGVEQQRNKLCEALKEIGRIDIEGFLRG